MTDIPLRQQQVMHMRLGRGGYVYGYKIIDEAGVHIGDKSIELKTSKDKEVITYTLGDAQFSTAEEFIEAYKAKIESDRRDKEWESAAP